MSLVHWGRACSYERNDRMRGRRRRRREQSIPWHRIGITLIVLGILAVISLLALAGYSALEPDKAEDLYTQLFGPAEDILKRGAAEEAFALADSWKEEIHITVEIEEPMEEKEKLPEIDPALRIPNTVDFAALWEQNPDVYAWITVPGTLVDYPVLQHPADDEYYLNHTIDHRAGLPGSIYSESLHPKDFSGVHTILYGHNMKNDTMFGSLHSYADPDFFAEHPYVYIHLPDRTLLYEIFAAVKFQSTYLPNYLNYEDETDFETYVEELKASPGNTASGREVPFGSRILTLHTCIGNDKNHRYLVTAVLTGEYRKE